MTQAAAFFDFDGTLFAGQLWRGITRYHLVHRKKLLLWSLFLATHTLMFPLYFGRLLSEERLISRWAEDLAIVLEGLTPDEVAKIFHWVRDNYAVNSLRPETLAALRQHQAKGDQVVLLSATFQELLELIGYKLGVTDVLGTKLEVAGGRYTGRIVPPLCFGVHKVELLQGYINATNGEVDLSSSYAYADSIHDLPVLEMVGNPVAVYPDRKLRDYARRRGWQVWEKGKKT